MPIAEREQRAPVERLFFALWPDDRLRQQLIQHRDTFFTDAPFASAPSASALSTNAPAGHLLPPENLHVTLAFLGRTDARQRACIDAVATAIKGPPFTLQFDHFGYWPRPRVLWIAPTQMPEALTHLAAALHAGAESCGLQLDPRPYQAHVTLARKLSARKLPQPPQDADCAPLHWAVDHFVLVRSRTQAEGVKYDVVGEWGLRC